ncbi:MAG: thioesterase family protein, partial [Ilumatobacter sp.]|uniref:thioesterase family protein n=1 Tax=Ilumatobacter sp. TaxID=1967498 RepID=UPI003C7195B3
PALFESVDRPDLAPGDWWTATEYARGPWDPLHCHGGPVSAMLARACETVGDDEPGTWQIARLTIELTRPVPVGEPLLLSSDVERGGRKVSVVAASLSDANGVEVAKVRALRIRRRHFTIPEHPTAPPRLSGEPGTGRLEKVSWAVGDGTIAFHSHGAEHRIVDGSWNDPGPISLWIRLTTVLVAGEPLSGVQRAAAAADFGNGVSSAIDFEDYLFINPDLTVHLARPPVGEWIGMVSHSRYGTDTMSTGAGFAESELYDADGRVGRSIQSLFVDPR